MGEKDIKVESLLLQYFCLMLLEEETNAIIAIMRGGDDKECQTKNKRMKLTNESLKRRKEELVMEVEKILHKPIHDMGVTMQEYLTRYNVAYDEREEIYYVIPKFMDPKAEKYQVQLGSFMSIHEACEYLNGKKRKPLF